MVTVEAAVAVCALLLVVSLAAAGLTAFVEQIRCTDAAREAARLVARGEQARGEQVAGEIVAGAVVVVHSEADAVRVVVRKRGPLGVPLTAEAVAVPEPR